MLSPGWPNMKPLSFIMLLAHRNVRSNVNPQSPHNLLQPGVACRLKLLGFVALDLLRLDPNALRELALSKPRGHPGKSQGLSKIIETNRERRQAPIADCLVPFQLGAKDLYFAFHA